jgi:hypothetical protein
VSETSGAQELADYFDKVGDHAQASWHRRLAEPALMSK